MIHILVIRRNLIHYLPFLLPLMPDETVVNGCCRVRANADLRVVWVEVMPRIFTGNLSSSTYMIAKKIAQAALHWLSRGVISSGQHADRRGRLAHESAAHDSAVAASR